MSTEYEQMRTRLIASAIEIRTGIKYNDNHITKYEYFHGDARVWNIDGLVYFVTMAEKEVPPEIPGHEWKIFQKMGWNVYGTCVWFCKNPDLNEKEAEGVNDTLENLKPEYVLEKESYRPPRCPTQHIRDSAGTFRTAGEYYRDQQRRMSYNRV